MDELQNKIEFHIGTTPHVHPSPSSQITFTFSVKSVTYEWLDSAPQTLLSETHVDLATISVFVPFRPAFHYEEAYADILELIEDWPVSDDVNPHMVASLALSNAMHQMQNAPQNHDMFVNVHVIEFRHNYRDRFIPADESTIEALEITRVDSGICSVCLEVVREGTLMPCRHVFHTECIRRWLRISHYCPDCRFSMPRRT